MTPRTSAAYRRARRAFWALMAVAVLLTGTLSALLRAPAGPVTGIAVALLGVLTAIAVALAGRVLLALTGRLAARAGRPAPRTPRPKG